MQLEPFHELVLRFIEQTDRPIFLTGKAGTGKTTFLRYIKASVSKNLAIVAPTAVAAINAGGVTIHSFFQVPFGPQVPGNNIEIRQVSQEKDKILKCLDLLIIDEISMVRADTIDYIDTVLRQVKGSSRPFGGVQLLMIGDLYQLPPVYEKDWPVLQRFYTGPYFFHSLAFQQVAVLTFELTQVYRQKDPVFVDILNDIRNGYANNDMLTRLNAHYRPQLNADEIKDHVTLSTHNKLVDEINQLRLAELDGEAHTFKATITGDFPKEGYPAEEQLLLKTGAQVMFIKNDSSGKKQYYNGRTGRITDISPTSIRLSFLDDGTEFDVNPETWSNVKYALAENDQKVSEANNGSFSQYPLRLAWAITIHKSQGLTFDKAVIDVDSAFAFGQTYVALSRCRSLEGMILKAPVRTENIRTDPAIVRFMQQAIVNVPDARLLEKTIREIEIEVLKDIFDFSVLTDAWQRYKPHLLNGEPANSALTVHIGQADLQIQNEIRSVGGLFVRKELSALTAGEHNWTDVTFKTRLQNAAAYFVPKLTALITAIDGFYLAQKSNNLSAEYYEAMNPFMANLRARTAAFIQLPTAGSTQTILSAIQQAGLRYRPVQKNWNPKPAIPEKEISNPQLYAQLLEWRVKASKERKVLEYALVSDNMLSDITTKLPRTLQELAALKGFSTIKARDLGDDILKLIRGYLGEGNLFG
ncbi:AAA family ATPase [Mucilaginibacter sp. HMF5004]|uniref:HRDC domain-containing protein n=1 Tax=Mucilaginibacter rivuli TaxID=2857527 RepID=UPI001C5FFFC3|nr:HRDC domain-containing protein [Mucilaginibacter rivuli]MBW4888990.1 AAA family ATPase [Mucilaginibacter rivuli]